MAELESWSEEDVDDEVVEQAIISASAGLLKRRKDIELPKEITFIETLLVDGTSDCQDLDVNDDLSRELAFYEQALEATNNALRKLDSLKVPTQRPEDYFAEMVKTDKHMASVRSKLVKEKSRMDVMEQRKRDRELRTFGKTKQKEVANERRKQAADNIKDVKKWQKRRKAGLTDEVELEDLLSKKQDPLKHKRKKVAPEDEGAPAKAPYQPTQTHRRRNKGEKKMSKKQEYKQQKFGRGGKRESKYNTKESSNDTRSFRAGRNNGRKPPQKGRGKRKR